MAAARGRVSRYHVPWPMTGTSMPVGPNRLVCMLLPLSDHYTPVAMAASLLQLMH